MTVEALYFFIAFLVLLSIGVPISTALGLTGVLAVAMFDLGISMMPAQIYAGVAKYPLLALPIFIFAGMLFDRSGVATHLVTFASSLVGARRGALAVVAILVCMFLGGISGSGPADAAAVAVVMIPSMVKNGYPKAFAASVIASASSTAIIIPPSIAFIIYSIIVPQASIPALFVGGIIPGILAGLFLMIPTILISRKYDFGAPQDHDERPAIWPSFKKASWGLLAPVIILGGLRTGLFTPTEVAAVAAAYGLFVGVVIYRTLDLSSIYRAMVDSAELAAVVMIIVALAGVFAFAGTTLGAFEAISTAMVNIAPSETVLLLVIMATLLFAGMLLDAISVYLIFLPILLPLAQQYDWDPVWLGIVITMNLAIGQFTPPIAVNLLVTTQVAGISIESTVKWVIWMVLSMGVALILVTFVPEIALWLPRLLGYL